MFNLFVRPSLALEKLKSISVVCLSLSCVFFSIGCTKKKKQSQNSSLVIYNDIVNTLMQSQTRPVPYDFLKMSNFAWPSEETANSLIKDPSSARESSDYWVRSGGLKQLVNDLEFLYPGGMYVFVGRDSADFADALDFFYLSLGQRCRVWRLGASRQLWGNNTYEQFKENLADIVESGEWLPSERNTPVAPECRPKLQDYADNPLGAPPLVYIDSTNYSASSGNSQPVGQPSQIRQIVMATYERVRQKVAAAKVAPADWKWLITKISALDIQNSDFSKISDLRLPKDQYPTSSLLDAASFSKYANAQMKDFDLFSEKAFYPQTIFKFSQPPKGYGWVWHNTFSKFTKQSVEGQSFIYTEPKDYDLDSDLRNHRRKAMNTWLETFKWLQNSENGRAMVETLRKQQTLQNPNTNWFKMVPFSNAGETVEETDLNERLQTAKPNQTLRLFPHSVSIRVKQKLKVQDTFDWYEIELGDRKHFLLSAVGTDAAAQKMTERIANFEADKHFSVKVRGKNFVIFNDIDLGDGNDFEVFSSTANLDTQKSLVLLPIGQKIRPLVGKKHQFGPYWMNYYTDSNTGVGLTIFTLAEAGPLARMNELVNFIELVCQNKQLCSGAVSKTDHYVVGGLIDGKIIANATQEYGALHPNEVRGRLTQLRHLKVRNNENWLVFNETNEPISNAFFNKILAELAPLKLKISGLEIANQKLSSIDFIANMPKLARLKLINTEIQDLRPIENCCLESLVSLEMSDTSAQTSQNSKASTISKLINSNLQTLVAINAGIGTNSDVPLILGNQLRFALLDQNPQLGAIQFRRAPNLRVLSLDGTGVQDIEFIHPGLFPKLEALSLGASKVDIRSLLKWAQKIQNEAVFLELKSFGIRDEYKSFSANAIYRPIGIGNAACHGKVFKISNQKMLCTRNAGPIVPASSAHLYY